MFLKDMKKTLVDPSNVCGYIPSAVYVSELVPVCSFADRSIQWKVPPRRMVPRLRRHVFLSSGEERTRVYTSGS